MKRWQFIANFWVLMSGRSKLNFRLMTIFCDSRIIQHSMPSGKYKKFRLTTAKKFSTFAFLVWTCKWIKYDFLMKPVHRSIAEAWHGKHCETRNWEFEMLFAKLPSELRSKKTFHLSLGCRYLHNWVRIIRLSFWAGDYGDCLWNRSY